MKYPILKLALIILMTCCCTPLTEITDHSGYTIFHFDELFGGSFVKESRPKKVRIDAVFGYMFLSQDVPGYPSNQWVRIKINNDSMRFDQIMVPESQAEYVFGFLMGEPITIYAETFDWPIEPPKGVHTYGLRVTNIIKRQTDEVVSFPDLSGWILVYSRKQDGVEAKTYQNGKIFLTVYYEEGQPTGFWKTPDELHEAKKTYCDKDRDGKFETVLINNRNCYYLGK